MPTVADPNDYEAVANPNDYEVVAQPAPVATIPRSGAQMESLGAREFLATPESKAAGDIRGAGDQPVIPIPRIPQQEGVVAQLGAGAVNAAANLAETFETPQLLASLPVMPMKLTQLLFGGQALGDIKTAYEEAARPETTIQKGLELGGRALTDALFGVGMVHGAVGGLAEPRSLTPRPDGLTESLFGKPEIQPEQSQLLEKVNEGLAAGEQPSVPTPAAETPTTVSETTATRQAAPETIAGVSMRMRDGTIFTSKNHPLAQQDAYKAGYTVDDMRGADAGFVTDTGRFVDRKEAQQIATGRTSAYGLEASQMPGYFDLPEKASPVSEGGAGTQALISKEGTGVETPPAISQTTPEGQATIDAGSKPVAKAIDLSDPDIPITERGPSIALKLDDGTVVYDSSSRLHSQVLEKAGVEPTRVIDSGIYKPISREFVSKTPDSVEIFPKSDTGAPPVAPPVSESGLEPQAPVSKEASGVAPTEAGQLFPPSEIPFNLRGEEPPPEIGKEGAARAKAEATYAQEKAQTQLFEPELSKEEQARVQAEYEQSLIDEYHQHAERGGEELLDAVKTSGKLPALSHPQVQQFSGELKNIREAYKGPRSERIKYSDIFSKSAVDLDELTRNLKLKGFDVETPADTLALVEDRIRTGKPRYGSEARGQALSDQSFQHGMGAAASKESLPGQTVTPGVRETGISQALHERRAGGQIDTGEGVSAERMVTRGRELLQHGYDPDSIVDYVTQGGAVTGDEMAVLRAHIENLSKATNRAQDLADANPSDVQLQQNAEAAFQNEAEWRQKIKPAATEWHRAGQAMQGETDIDTGTFTGLRRAFLEVKGRDATAGEQAKLTDLADKTQKADAAVNEVKSRYDEVVKKETANLPPISPDQLAFGENFGVGVNPKSEITDLTRIIWKVAKDGYIDKGVTSLDDTIHGVALDTGLTSDVVRDALTKPKAIRQITNEMYAKMAARRNMVNAVKDYINAKDEPQWKRVIKAVWETPFSLAIYGHGTVGGLTHAGANIFRPTKWSAYWPDFVNQAKFFAKPGIHEAAMQKLVRDPNFITGKRAGLANDPNLTYTDYGAYAKFFGLQGGRRGFDALKTMRQSMFNAYWDKIPDSVKSDPAAAKEVAKGYADMVNHATGVISNSDRGFLATAARAGSPIAFAAKLEASRWARVIGDPVKTSDTFARWNQATPAEKSVAIQRTKNAAEFAAVFVGSLYLNQAILSASGSKEKINFTDPSRSDWLKHKIAGHDVAVDGGLLAPIRLLGRLTYDTLVRPRQELRGDTRTTAAIKDIGQYAMGKASPSVSIAKEAVTAESFDGRLLPWSRDTSKKPKMTWTEYATSHGPIPLSGATKEIYDSMRERGMSSPDAKSYLRGLAAFGSELTGARVTPSREEKAPTVKSTKHSKQQSGQSIPAGKTP